MVKSRCGASLFLTSAPPPRLQVASVCLWLEGSTSDNSQYWWFCGLVVIDMVLGGGEHSIPALPS